MPVLRHTTTTAPDLMSNSSSAAAAANITATTKFINEAINQLHHMMDWTVQHVVHLLNSLNSLNLLFGHLIFLEGTVRPDAENSSHHRP